MSSPSIDIFTDGGDEARALLERFETLGRIFRESNVAPSPPRLRVFIFSSERDFEKYRPAPSTAGFFRSDDDQDVIVLAEGNQLKYIASHEYLHRVIQHASPLLPGWLNEGLPSFIPTISVSGTKCTWALSSKGNRVLLLGEPWLDAEDLALGNRADGRIFSRRKLGAGADAQPFSRFQQRHAGVREIADRRRHAGSGLPESVRNLDGAGPRSQR